MSKVNDYIKALNERSYLNDMGFVVKGRDLTIEDIKEILSIKLQEYGMCKKGSISYDKLMKDIDIINVLDVERRNKYDKHK